MRQPRLLGRGAFISSRINQKGNLLLLVITMKQRISSLRLFVRVSDLSATVGRVLAYRGGNG
jgi:hypothetical protein